MQHTQDEQWVVRNERLREVGISRQAISTDQRPQTRADDRRVTNAEIPVATLELPITAMALVRDVSTGGVQITTRSSLGIGDTISFKLVDAQDREHILNGTVRHVSWNGGSGDCTAGLGWHEPTSQALQAWQGFVRLHANSRPSQSEAWIPLNGHKAETE